MKSIINNMKSIIVILVLMFCVTGSNIYSQVGVKIGPLVGLTFPAVDYGGETNEFYAGTKYGLHSGIHYGLMGKVKLGPLNGRLSVSYASLDNSGHANPNQTNSTVELNQNVFMFTLGTEYGFAIPQSPVRMYGGLDLLFSSLSGTYNFQGTSEVSSGQKSMESASRTGLGLAIGAELIMGKMFTLDVSLRYNLINLFSKNYDGLTNSNDRNDAYRYLNDAQDPNYSPTNSKHPIGNNRTIATVQFNAGLLFGF